MKKNWGAIFVITFWLLLMFSPVIAFWCETYLTNPFDYARITDLEYKAILVDEVGSQGKVIITERITFDIHAASEDNTFWELWRELPVDSIDGLTNEYQVNSVKQIYDDGSELVYSKSPKLYWDDSDYTSSYYGPGKWYYDEYDECVLFYIDGVYRDELVFEIEYEMTNTVFKYNDSSELYLTMYSGNTIKYLDSLKGEILIADKDMPSKNNYEVYTYGTRNDSFDYEVSTTKNPGYHTFYFDLDEDDLKFDTYNQFIEFTLIAFGTDKHVFADFASTNRYTYYNCLDELRSEYTDFIDESNGYRQNKRILLAACLGISVFVIWYSTNTDKRMRKKYLFFNSSHQSQSSSYIPSTLDPIFAATLVFSKEERNKEVEDGYSAIMLSLVRKGYIELVRINESIDWTVNNVQIVINYEPAKYTTSTYMMPPGQASMLGNSSYLSPAQPLRTYTPMVMDRTNYQSNTFTPRQMGSSYTGLNNINNNFDDINNLNNDTLNNDTLNNSTLNTSNITNTNNYSNYNNINNVNTNSLNNNIDTYSNTFNTLPVEENPLEETKLLEPLTLPEEHYFKLILRHSYGAGSITLANFQSRIYNDYDNTDTFVRNMEDAVTNIGISQGYFQKADYKQPMKSLNSLSSFYLTAGIILITLVNLISSMMPYGFAYGGYTILGIVLIVCCRILKKNAHKYVLLTQFGEDEYVKWRALYNFLNSDEVMKDSNLTNVTVCEQYLIYATAFGIADKLINALNIKCPEIVKQSKILNNRYYRSSSFRTHSRSIRTTTRRASSLSRSGGYSSGGRGGGGGGGGH